MIKYILRRLLMFIPVLLAVTFIVYSILSLTPGDPAEMVAGTNATRETIEEVRIKLGLDKPFIVQYYNYMRGLLRGNFGTSYYSGQAVSVELTARIPQTLKLATGALFVMLLIAIPIGIISAVKQYSLLDTFSTVFALTGVAMPNFWLGLLLIILFSLKLGILPSGGSSGVLSLILPTVTLGFTSAATIMRTTRSSMLEVIRQDYIRTAYSKGVTKPAVVLKHAFRNALLPIVTAVGLSFGNMLSGSTVIETVFSWPGLGRLVVDSVQRKDTPTVLGCIIIYCVIYSVMNLLVDLLYGFLDPRIKSLYQ
jgi:peptide/nickel transport system permease protein